MFKKALLCASLAGSVVVLPTASADDTFARFKGGIGVIPVSSGVALPAPSTQSEVVNRNFVRGVAPPGQIWLIEKLDAKVSMNARISVEGKGLILGGGNNVGRATGQSVFATLICDLPGFEQHSTTLTGVPLTTTGDFKINDTLSPAPPGDCPNPVLLIRTAGSGNWFAAGIWRPKDD